MGYSEVEQWDIAQTAVLNGKEYFYKSDPDIYSKINFLWRSGVNSPEHNDRINAARQAQAQPQKITSEVGAVSKVDLTVSNPNKLPARTSQVMGNVNPNMSYATTPNSNAAYYSVDGLLGKQNIPSFIPRQSLNINLNPKPVGLTFSSSPAPYSFGTNKERPSVIEIGAPMSTPTELSNFNKGGNKGSGLVTYNIDTKDLNEAFRQGALAGTTPYEYRIGASRNMGNYEFNYQSIARTKNIDKQMQDTSKAFESNPLSFSDSPYFYGKSTASGEEYGLTPEYFSKNIDFAGINKVALIEAKGAFNNLPVSTQTRLRIGSLATTSTQFGLGVYSSLATGYLNLGSAQVKQSDLNNYTPFTLGRTFRLNSGNYWGDIANARGTQATVKPLENPLSYLKQKVFDSPEFQTNTLLVLPAAYAGTVGISNNIGNYGVKGGILETVSYFSPLRLESGIYTPNLQKATYNNNVKSYVTDSESGLTKLRFTTGQDSNKAIKFFNIESFDTGAGEIAGKTFTKSPYLKIQGGGGIFEFGTRETSSLFTGERILTSSVASRFINENGKSMSFGLDDTRGAVFRQTRTPLSDVYYPTSKGGGIFSNENLGSVQTSSVGGFSKQISANIKQFSSGKATAIYTFEQSQDISIYKPSGKYKLTPNVFGAEKDISYLGSSGRWALNLKAGSFLADKRGTLMPPQLEQPKPIQTFDFNAPTLAFPNSVGALPSSVSAFPILRSQEKTTTLIIPDSATKTKTSNVITPVLFNPTETKGKTRDYTIPSFSFGQPTAQASKQEQITSQLVIPTTTGILLGKALMPSSWTTSSFPDMPLGFGGDYGKRRRYGIKSRRKYTPDFTSLIRGIRGRQPRGIETGSRLRPITRGFKWEFSSAKLPSLKI